MRRYAAIILAAVGLISQTASAAGVAPIVLPRLGNAPALYQPAPADPLERERYCTALALVHFHRIGYIDLTGQFATPGNAVSQRQDQALSELLRDDNRRGCSDRDRAQFALFKSTVFTHLSDGLRARLYGQLNDNFMGIVTRGAPAEIMFNGLGAFFQFEKKKN